MGKSWPFHSPDHPISIAKLVLHWSLNIDYSLYIPDITDPAVAIYRLFYICRYLAGNELIILNISSIC
jgi:hypothetical protein